MKNNIWIWIVGIILIILMFNSGKKEATFVYTTTLISSNTPNIISGDIELISYQGYIIDNTFEAKFTLKNKNVLNHKNVLLELIPRSTTKKVSFIRENKACDLSTPQNVHTYISISPGATHPATVRIPKILSPDEYDIHIISFDSCCSLGDYYNPNCQPVSPFYGNEQKIATIRVESQIQQYCGDNICQTQNGENYLNCAKDKCSSYCGDKLCDTSKETINNCVQDGCTNTEIISSNGGGIVQTCTDSDNGLTYDKIGTVSLSSGNIVTDFCLTENTLVEYSCDSTNPLVPIRTEYDCGDNKSCKGDAMAQNGLCGDLLQPNVPDKVTATQLPILLSELNEVSSTTLVRAACKINENCIQHYEDLEGGTNYSVRCAVTTKTKDLLEQAVEKECDISAFKLIFGVGTVACGVGAILLLIPPTAFVGAPLLLGCVPGTVAIGGATLAWEGGCRIIKEGKGEGLCLATKPGEKVGSLCYSWADSIARSLGMNGSCQTNSLMVIGTLIIIFGFVYSKL